VNQQTTSRVTQFLPQVVVATTVVVVLPVVVVWVLLAEGVISSPLICLGLALALSLAASTAGSAYWKRRGGHGDVLFSELLLWGWLHRYRAERRLANSVDLLGITDAKHRSAPTDESTERTAKILRQMAAALDAQDSYTDGHSRRVAVHAAMIAHKMGLPREEIAKVRTAAAVHDIGKLRTPPEVLNKAGMLTAAEFEVVKRHVDDGAEIVSVMEDPELTATVRHHHERFDGHGYPDRLVGHQTPVAARIIAVADTFDALTSVRPYRAAIPHKKALTIIVDASGTQLDPVAVRAFLRCYSGRRWVVFWTLLAASPQRALSVLTGRQAGSTNLASAATIAAPAALAVVVAAAVGSAGIAGSIGRTRGVLTLARRPVPHVATGSKRPSAKRTGGHPGARAEASSSTHTPARHALLGITGAHHRTRGPVAGPSRGASSGRGPRGGGGASGGTRSGGGPIKKGGGGSRPGRHSPPPGGSPGRPGTPVVSGGGGGGQHPPSKADCMHGGFVNFGFRNQGQCIASVEHRLHHLRHAPDSPISASRSRSRSTSVAR
jgi:putative nucleotidyltransferase with HDIG domain